MSDRIAVMYLGRIVELAQGEDLFTSPQHPYTQALLTAVPVPDPELVRSKHRLHGEMASPIHPPPGCHLHARCPNVQEICRKVRPELRRVGKSLVACHFPEEERD